MKQDHSGKLEQNLRAEWTLQADESTGCPEHTETDRNAKQFRLENFCPLGKVCR